MSTKATGNKKHLTLADRAAIEHGLSLIHISVLDIFPL